MVNFANVLNAKKRRIQELSDEIEVLRAEVSVAAAAKPRLDDTAPPCFLSRGSSP